MSSLDQGLIISDGAICCGVLDEDAEELPSGKVNFLSWSHLQANAERFSPRSKHCDRLGVAVLGDKECRLFFACLLPCDTPAHGHGLCGRRCLIEQ